MEALAAKRPDAETAPFTTLVPKISPGLKKDAEALVQKSGGSEENGTVPIGEPCKNGGCKKVRQISNMAAVFHFQSPFTLCYYVCPFAALRRQRRERVPVPPRCSHLSRGHEVLVLLQQEDLGLPELSRPGWVREGQVQVEEGSTEGKKHRMYVVEFLPYLVTSYCSYQGVLRTCESTFVASESRPLVLSLSIA